MSETPHRRGQDHDGLLHRPAITPALTAEEWAGMGVKCLLVPIGQDGKRGMYAVDGWPVAIPSQHAVAAFALHGQPFGFTAEDVANLRYLAHERGEFADEMGNLADRIAALLPPA